MYMYRSLHFEESKYVKTVEDFECWRMFMKEKRSGNFGV